MARIKITIPENKIASVTIPVRITDINYGNHLGNDALVSIVHEARVQWLKTIGYTELNVAGVGLIMSDLAIEYVNESFYGDDLQINIAAGDVTRVSFELFYTIQVTRDEKLILIAKAKTGMVCYDYVGKKVAAVPQKLKELLAY
ncbi:MAG: thioesterase family protein [Ferruginibacter sp.]